MVGSLGDQALYLGNASSDKSDLFSNTNITYRVYNILQYILPGKLSTLVPIAFSSIFLYKTLRVTYKYLSRNEKFATLAVFFIPHFWIWQAAASKEAIIIPFGLFLVYIFSKSTYFKINNFEKLMILVSCLFIFLIKPIYLTSYLFIYIAINIEKIINKIKEFKPLRDISPSVFFLSFSLTSLLLILITYIFFYEKISEYIIVFLMIAKLHFLSNVDASTSRLFLDFETPGDLLTNLSWALPASLIGLLPNEINQNPVLFILFLEGSFSLLLGLYINFIYLQHVRKTKKSRATYFFGFLPALILLILIQYLLGIYNIGTSIRYKQAIIPIIYFFPLYMISLNRLALRFNIKVRG
tara:strand:+ start:7176 stop:8237 length:1062 start_codon:yes stop_codon:yes gene_type:complete